MTQRCFNIIDSVKGGSGKTSLSLMLTLAAQRYIQKENPTADAGKIRHSLLMDMDMQGSSLAYLLFENSKADQDGGNESNRAPCTLNDAILRYYRRKAPQFISTPEFFFSNDLGGVPSNPEEPTEGGETPKNSYKIAVALASTKMLERDRFRAVSRMNYSSQITYDAFGAGLRAVLKASNLNSYLPDRLEYVFFDMPPNSNGYSDCVLDLLLSGAQEKPTIDLEYPRNYFELMTLDCGHISATLDWFEQFVTQGQYRFPDHFFFVFNNVPPNISRMEYNEAENHFNDVYLREAVAMIQERLNILKLVDSDRNRVYFVGVSYQEEYLKRCCSAGSLLSSVSSGQLSTEMLTPIKFLMSMDGKYSADCTDELLKLMCTSE